MGTRVNYRGTPKYRILRTYVRKSPQIDCEGRVQVKPSEKINSSQNGAQEQKKPYYELPQIFHTLMGDEHLFAKKGLRMKCKQKKEDQTLKSFNPNVCSHVINSYSSYY
jgi:hypothetical protein